MKTFGKPFLIVLSVLLAGLPPWVAFAAGASGENYPIVQPPFGQVRFLPGPLQQRQAVNGRVSIDYCLDRMRDEGAMRNLDRAAGTDTSPYEAPRDSMLAKALEGAWYQVGLDPSDTDLAERAGALTDRFLAAIGPDGYFNTWVTVQAPDSRWSNLAHGHELYVMGHLIEMLLAAARHGSRPDCLEAARRVADRIDADFGPQARRAPPGHPGVEIALLRLYEATGEVRYRRLARFFIDRRGRTGQERELYGEYSQDHLPVFSQRRAVGHAVRALYLYVAMADLAQWEGDPVLARTLDTLWRDVVSTKFYATGNVGARHDGEAFGNAFELPNRLAYNETCAAVGLVYWADRMFRRLGQAQYYDVIERCLYNALSVGVNLEGDRFFYVNPLESNGRFLFNFDRGAGRFDWSSCPCCPPNLARFFPTLGRYLYARRGQRLYVNLFAASRADWQLHNGCAITLVQRTEYPADGRVLLELEPARPVRFQLALRLPGWVRGRPLPSDLYRYEAPGGPGPRLLVNGQPCSWTEDQGYAVVERCWQAGDRVEWLLPMPVRRLRGSDRIEACRDRVAFERGPLLYCAESADLDRGSPLGLVLRDAPLPRLGQTDPALGGLPVLHARGVLYLPGRRQDRPLYRGPVDFRLVPYAVWNNRGPGAMRVWFPDTTGALRLPDRPNAATTARVSASWLGPTMQSAITDLWLPRDSGDYTIPRFTWWDRRGSEEWALLEFSGARELGGADVYWYDDTARGGGCRTPESWRLEYRSAGRWLNVELMGPYEVEPDRFNSVRFRRVQADALRLRVQLPQDYSSGILEWRVRP